LGAQKETSKKPLTGWEENFLKTPKNPRKQRKTSQKREQGQKREKKVRGRTLCITAAVKEGRLGQWGTRRKRGRYPRTERGHLEKGGNLVQDCKREKRFRKEITRILSKKDRTREEGSTRGGREVVPPGRREKEKTRPRR